MFAIFVAWMPGHWEKNLGTGEWRWVDSQWSKEWTREWSKEYRCDGTSTKWSLRNRGKGPTNVDEHMGLVDKMETSTGHPSTKVPEPEIEPEKSCDPDDGVVGSWSWKEAEQHAEYLSSLEAQRPKAKARPVKK